MPSVTDPIVSNPLLKNTIRRNPVLTAELNHQWYVMEKSRSGRLWIVLAVVMLVPALLTSLILFVRALTGVPVMGIPVITGGQLDLLTSGQVILLVMNIALTVVVMLVSFGLSTNSITREKRGKTWDNLILTNISARTLVFGKWLASLRALDGDHIMVGLLRLGLIAWIAAGFQDRLPVGTASIPAHVLLLTILMVVFSVVDAMFNTALGVGIVLSDLPEGVSTALFFLFRGLGIIYCLWLIVQIVGRLYAEPGTTYFLPGMLGLAVYLAITGVVLLVAERIAVRNSLVSPGMAQ